MIENFLDVITHEKLKGLAAHWDQARGSNPMPAWKDICPRDIAVQLPLTWSFAYHEQEDKFIGRLAGDRIESVVGKSFRGINMCELFSGHEYEWLYLTCKRVVITRALHCGSGSPLSGHLIPTFGERIVMPLSTDGLRVDGILGATVYPDLGAGGKSPVNFYEREWWFPIPTYKS